MRVIEKRAFVVPLDIGAVDPANGQVHLGKTPGGLVGLLPVDGNQVGGIEADALAFLFVVVLMGGNKLLALDKHAAGAAAGVEYPAFVWFEHFNQELDNASGSVELSALFPFGQGKLPEEIFIDLAEHILAFCLFGARGQSCRQGR